MTKKELLNLRLGSKITFGNYTNSVLVEESVLVGFEFVDVDCSLVLIDDRYVKHLTKESMIQAILQENLIYCDLYYLLEPGYKYVGQADITERDIIKIMMSQKQPSYTYLTKDTLCQAAKVCFDIEPLHAYRSQLNMIYALSKREYIIEPDISYALDKNTILYDYGYIEPDWNIGYSYTKLNDKVLLQISEHEDGVIENPLYNITDVLRIKELVPHINAPVSSFCYKKDIVQYVYKNRSKYDQCRNKEIKVR